VVLLYARPEDVNDLRRSAGCTVIGTGFDDAPAVHVRAVELALESAKRSAEAGGHVVVLLDSLGRYARAVHAVLTGAPAVKGAPLEAGALERAARLFASGKAIEGGGSLTLLAAWVTESRDEPFVTTLRELANAELFVDKTLVDKRLVPALGLPHTASQHTHADAWIALRADLLRRLLEPMQVVEAAALIAERMQHSSSNHALLEGMNQ
jgi:transcription termination factor Rho